MEASAAFTAYKMFNASAAGRSCKLLGVFKGIADFGDQASRAAKPSATASNERATASEEGVQGGTPVPAAAAAPAHAVMSKEQCQRKATQNAALVFLRGVVPYLQRKLPGDYAPEASSYVRAVERKELLGAVENHHKAALKAKAGGQPASFNSAHVSYPWVNVSSVDHTDTVSCLGTSRTCDSYGIRQHLPHRCDSACCRTCAFRMCKQTTSAFASTSSWAKAGWSWPSSPQSWRTSSPRPRQLQTSLACNFDGPNANSHCDHFQRTHRE